MSPLHARLDVVAGKATGMSILVDDELLIGRLVDGAGRLADDEEISRTHARVRLDPEGQCTIEDLGSTNGTFVNGVRISAQRTLAEGDTIELGSTTMVVREVPQPSVEEDFDRTVLERPMVPELTSEGAAAGGSDAGTASVSDASGGAVPLGAEPSSSGAAPLGVEPSTARLGADTDTVDFPPPQVEPVDQPPRESPEAEMPLKLSLQLEVDIAGGQARVWFDKHSEPVRLVFDGGAWRPAPEQESGFDQP